MERGPGGEVSRGNAPASKTFALAILLLLLSAPAHPETYTLPLPGTLLQVAAVSGPGGRPGIALLVAANRDGTGAKSLLFLDPARRGVERLMGGLHEEVSALAAFDLTGQGTVPVAGMPGVLFAPAAGGGARRVLEQPNVDLRSVTGALAGRPWLPLARTGLLELFGSASGTLARHASFPLPVRAERLRWGLSLTSPPVTLLTGDPPLFAIGPEKVGRRRLKTLLLPSSGGEMEEAWSLLPADERLTDDRRYLRFDGTPALAAATFEKIGLLAKKRFRLFVLGKDRSRKGSPPVLAFETECPLWYPLDAASVNAVGDLDKDLVLVHPGGLRGKELQVTVYRGAGRGKFEPQPRRWKLDDEATDWLYGTDLTADGVPDLLVMVKGRLLLYAGDAAGSRPLAGRPVWSVTVAGAPQKDRRESGEEEAPDFERERFLSAFNLPGGERIALARGVQQDGRTVLTVVRR
jgi:hypothetical protein